MHLPCIRVPRLGLLTCRLTLVGLLIALEGISSVVLYCFLVIPAVVFGSVVGIWPLAPCPCSVVCCTVERYPGIGYIPVLSFREGLLVSRNIRSSAGSWQSVQASSKLRSRLSLCVELPMCSSSLPLKHRIVSYLVNSKIVSSWFDRQESFVDEQTFARVMRACEV